MGPSLSLLGFEYFSMLFSALSYLNTIPRYPTVVWTHHQRVSWPPSLLVPGTIAETTRGRAKEKRRRREQRSGEEWKKGRDKEEEEEEEEEEASSNSPVGDFSSRGTYIRGHISRLAVERSALLLQASLSFPPRWLYVPTCIYTYIHTRGPPRTPPSPYTARRDRDAKETRAAFKLAATKRINSPGSLDLLIRAAVAFLRGLDRWGPETPRPSCFLAIASAAARPRAECVHACSFQLASTIVVALASSCRRPTLARFFGGGRGL